MMRSRYLLAGLLLAAWVCCACDTAESTQANPVPDTSGTLAPGTGGGSVTPPTDGGTRVRTVMTRNPLGGPPGNLLVDGDFELSVSNGWGQFPWLSYSYNGALKAETGGLCRTGLRCLVLDAGDVVLGRGTSANGAAMVASVWAKVPEGEACALVRAATIMIHSGDSKLLQPVAEEPGVDRWCRYEAHLPESMEATYFYVDSEVKYPDRVLVDSAELVPSTGSTPMAATEPRSPTAAEQQHFRQVVEWARKQRQLTAPPADAPR